MSVSSFPTCSAIYDEEMVMNAVCDEVEAEHRPSSQPGETIPKVEYAALADKLEKVSSDLDQALGRINILEAQHDREIESLKRETVDLKRRLNVRQLIFKGQFLYTYSSERSAIGIIIDVTKKKFGYDVQFEDVIWAQKLGRTAIVAEFQNR